MKKAVFFDFDGTLVNLNISWNKDKIFKILEQSGFRPNKNRPITEQVSKFHQFIKNKNEKVLNILFNFIKQNEQKFLQGIKNPSLTLQELFKSLKRKNYLIVIISRNHTSTIKKGLQKVGISADRIFGIDTLTKLKPQVDPKIFQFIKKNQIELKKSFMVGDACYDMEFADKIGLKKILMINPNLKKHFTRFADFVIKDIQELSKILK